MSRPFGGHLLDALGAREGERLAIVADAGREQPARARRGGAREPGLEVELVGSGDDYRREAEMPAAALAAIESADVALPLVAMSRIQFGGHSEFRKRATARGARVGFVTHDDEAIDAASLAAVADRTFVDKRLGGTVHFGLVDNRGLGGRAGAAIHTDVQVMDGRVVELDGTRGA